MFDPQAISYKFINAFPTSIQDVALTYQNSTVLQVTVEFAYDRYIIVTNQKLVLPKQIVTNSSKS